MTYSVAALSAAHQALVDLLDGVSGNATIELRDAGSVLLSSGAFARPCGTVAAETGQLTLHIASSESHAPATGSAATARIIGTDSATHLTLPCQEGTAAVSGYCVIDNLLILQGATVEFHDITIG